MSKGPLAEIDDVLDDLLTLLKNPDVGEALAARGVNVSLAMVVTDGLAAYLAGDKARAAEELETATEEIRSRMRVTDAGKPS